MDEDLKVISLEERRPWYKRAWKKLKKIGSKIADFCLDHIEIICGIVWAAVIGVWSWLFGWIAGRQEGYDIGKADGKREGLNEGYTDCISDLKSSGYQVYGGYGEDSSKMIVNKIVEVVKEEKEL